ncbi:MAG: YicC family protein [Gammaproteobacteria bacterium]|nr:YicC family protein [Gammaproteobacteria bacterium]
MVASMTAFARREQDGAWGRLVWELRALNHRYLELQVRLPEELRPLEPAVREAVGEALARGKIDATLHLRPGEARATRLTLNEAAAQRLIGLVHEVSERLPEAGRVSPLEFLRWPGMVEEPGPDLEPLQSEAMGLLHRTLEDLVATRRREGERIAEFVRARCRSVAELIAAERARRPQVLERLRARMRERIEGLGLTPDEARLEQELALAAQKLDVEEELDRLDAHVREVEEVLGRAEAVGRRLDFLMQELQREANTLGAKAGDSAAGGAAVDLKVLIEQMREQVQNIE